MPTVPHCGIGIGCDARLVRERLAADSELPVRPYASDLGTENGPVGHTLAPTPRQILRPFDNELVACSAQSDVQQAPCLGLGLRLKILQRRLVVFLGHEPWEPPDVCAFEDARQVVERVIVRAHEWKAARDLAVQPADGDDWPFESLGAVPSAKDDLVLVDDVLVRLGVVPQRTVVQPRQERQDPRTVVAAVRKCGPVRIHEFAGGGQQLDQVGPRLLSVAPRGDLVE